MAFIVEIVAFLFFYFWRDLFIKFFFKKTKFEDGSSLQRTLSTVFGSTLSFLSVIVFLWLSYLVLSGELKQIAFIFILLIKTALLVGYTEAYIRSKKFRDFLDTNKFFNLFIFILALCLLELLRYFGWKLSKDLAINYLWNLAPFLIWIIHILLRREVLVRIHYGKDND